MRLTQTVYESITRYRITDFVNAGIEYLHDNFKPIIAYRKIPNSNLDEAIRQSYAWVEKQGRPSQLLAMRTVCARLCFGSFFMQDPRFSELITIMHGQLQTEDLTDDDPIYKYIMQYRSDWLVDWFKENLQRSRDLVVSRQLLPTHSPDWLSNQQVLDKLFIDEKRESVQWVENWRSISQNFDQTANQSLPVAAGVQAVLLLAIAQYYDGYQCFNDPLRPRWYNCLLSENVQVKVYHLQNNFYEPS
ncbi:hypothetical protein [Serratia fonticola]